MPENRAGGTGQLTVAGGLVDYPGPDPFCVLQPSFCAREDPGGESVPDLVERLQDEPRNDDLLVTLDLDPVDGGPSQPVTIDSSKRLDQVVTGEQLIPVTVS
ncbi:MAG: hypothetical protein GEV03_03895 [Streptosporangiales bacterium]|nr:hypothetical protein [Streptosporangiales bacterium]